MTEKKKVIFRGPGLTCSGYGVHARQIIKWLLNRQDVDLRLQLLPWGATPWLLNPHDQDGLIGKIFSASSPFETRADVSFQLQLPNEWDPTIAKFNIGMTAGVETDVCNPQWISHCNAMDIVIVPSLHVKKTLERTGIIFKSVIVIPEAFPDKFLAAPAGENPFNFDTKFNFLMVGQVTGNNPENDRKNIFYSIKWFCETFKENPDVGLVIKANVGRNTPIDRNITLNMLTQLIREIGRQQFPKIHLIHGNMTDAEMQHLYTHPSVKALLSPTRGEGFGLPILEAAACGLPIIATNWSGHLDFLSHGKFSAVDYQLTPVHQTRIDGQIFMEGSKWATPLETDFKKNLRKFYDSPYVPRDWARDLQKIILEKYSFDSISHQYDEVLNKVP